MTNILTQKEMINIFVGNTEGVFYWRLKNLKLKANRNPEDETALTGKHKRVLPILTIILREHEYEILNFLAYLSYKSLAYFLWVRVFLCFIQVKEIVSNTLLRTYRISTCNN